MSVYQLTANSKTHFIHSFYVKDWRLQEVIDIARKLYNERYEDALSVMDEDEDYSPLLGEVISEAVSTIHPEKQHIAYAAGFLLKVLGKSSIKSTPKFPIGDPSPVKSSILKIAARKNFTLSGEKFCENEWHDGEGELSEYVEVGELSLPIYASDALSIIFIAGCQALWGMVSKEQAYDGDEDYSPNIIQRLSEVSEEVKEVLNDPCEYPLMNFLYRKEIEELFHPQLVNAMKMFNHRKESKFNPCVWEYSLKPKRILPNIGL